VSNGSSVEPVKYILDSTDPFDGFINKVERVLTDGGWELGLNDAGDPYAVSTPSAQVLRVPNAIVAQVDIPDHLKTKNLEVVYRANHPVINQSGSFNPDTYEVGLPYSHLEALLMFVASRVSNPIGMTNEFHAGNNYAAKYEQCCKDIETFNLRTDQGAQYDKLGRNGWV